MKAAFALVLLATPVFAANLSENIRKLIDATPAARTAFWGIQVLDLATGKTLYELNPNHNFIPASNTKLFSTALALTRLGPDHTFQTRVFAGAPPDANGRIAGDLRLIGGGDPNLSARAVPYRMGPITGNPLAAIEDLAEQVVARGVRRVDGDIVGDDTWYVWQPYAPGWTLDYPVNDDGPPVNALMVADNAFTMHVGPGAAAGEPAALSFNPPMEYYTIENRVRTVPPGSPREVRFKRIPGSRYAQLWGSIPLRDRGVDLALGIEDPAQYAALALRSALEERGVAVGGEARAHHVLPDEIADLRQGPPPEPVEGIELAHRTSAPFIEDLRITDKVSQNLHAELALRATGKAARNVGSLEAGMEELRAFLTEVGLDSAEYTFSDGSGLSRFNMVSPTAVVKLLRYMYLTPFRDSWISLLPVGAQDGSLSNRFGQTPAAGRVHAKTGSLSHVSALSGYIERPDATWLAFSILVNNYSGDTAAVRGVMDRICNLILE
jgi:serine-type D-Ala-D-Ala carboxypeptidase/endopeptidase (penicillin-binding protein 4)